MERDVKIGVPHHQQCSSNLGVLITVYPSSMFLAYFLVLSCIEGMQRSRGVEVGLYFKRPTSPDYIPLRQGLIFCITDLIGHFSTSLEDQVTRDSSRLI
jgi:hypothetical protein